MRIFLAGASGVPGVRLLPLLVAAGHTVAGMTRTPAKAERLRELGAEPIMCDVYDLPALTAAVTGFAPDLVLHQLTDLPDDRAQVGAAAAANDRIRREGTRNLLAAAGRVRTVAQSIAWEMTGERATTIADHERAVLDAGGVVLRYGQFYGPDTFYPDGPPPAPRISIDTAAARTLELLDRPSGVYVVTDNTGGSS